MVNKQISKLPVWETDRKWLVLGFMEKEKWVHYISFNKKSQPEPIIDYAQTNYDKFKVVSVYKHTNFAYGTRVDEDTNYEMVLKVNGDLTSVWFSASMNRYSDFDVSKLALK